MGRLAYMSVLMASLAIPLINVTLLCKRIWGEMAQNDFDIRVKPAGGDATKKLAKLYDGLIRNIETMSNASRVYAFGGQEGH